ncbi:hypothetical protein Y032_0227g2830 [Ancylostoma ceylanicum]|nr:hypothetical protein Y032_0227g2830 [Ancylostoma ceylanicum]
MKVNGLPAAVPDKAQAPTPAALGGGPSELLQLMVQGGQIPELNAETQAQLMALMMAGAAQPPVEEPSGEEQQTATSSVVPSFPMPPSLPPLMNPFLHGSTSMPSLFPSVGAPVDNAVAAGDAESVDMDDDDDCTTEDGRLQIDPDQ